MKRIATGTGCVLIGACILTLGACGTTDTGTTRGPTEVQIIERIEPQTKSLFTDVDVAAVQGIRSGVVQHLPRLTLEPEESNGSVGEIRTVTGLLFGNRVDGLEGGVRGYRYRQQMEAPMAVRQTMELSVSPGTRVHLLPYLVEGSPERLEFQLDGTGTRFGTPRILTEGRYDVAVLAEGGATGFWGLDYLVLPDPAIDPGRATRFQIAVDESEEGRATRLAAGVFGFSPVPTGGDGFYRFATVPEMGYEGTFSLDLSASSLEEEVFLYSLDAGELSPIDSGATHRFEPGEIERMVMVSRTYHPIEDELVGRLPLSFAVRYEMPVDIDAEGSPTFFTLEAVNKNITIEIANEFLPGEYEVHWYEVPGFVAPEALEYDRRLVVSTVHYFSLKAEGEVSDDLVPVTSIDRKYTRSMETYALASPEEIGGKAKNVVSWIRVAPATNGLEATPYRVIVPAEKQRETRSYDFAE